jgi:S1-C subfamily serine protease
VVEGTGFVVAPERVMTNAHVVAGVSSPVVTVPDGDTLEARVVVFDPRIDVAVLAVPGLDRPALTFRDDLARGTDAAVVGYPDNGPLSTEPVRVRGEHALLGRDIYGDDTVNRDVISIRGTVRPGNSGGPLVADDGVVYGMVFAASLTDPETGYALAVSELGPALEDAPAAVEPVSTAACA